MPDETLPETPPPATTPPAATAQQPTVSGAPSITPEVQAVIDARVREAVEHARNATWKQARETLGKKNGQAAHETPPAQQTTTQPPATTTTATGSSRAYERAIAAYDFPEEAMALLDEEFDRVKPADPRAFVEQRAAAFRVPKRGATTPTPTTVTPAAQASPASAPPAAAMPPVTGNAAPSSAARVTDDVPLIDRSAAEQAAYTKQHGFVAFTDRVTREARDRSTRLRLR